ncbi:autophagy protein 13, partial [Coemansia spiralis]
MSQRPHWSRHGSSHPGQAREDGDDDRTVPGVRAVDIARSPPRPAYDHAPAAGSSARGPDPRARQPALGPHSQQPVRLPPNSGSPAGAAQPASYSSSHSSSLSPSPSINPYGGSLRSIMHGAQAQARALPANIRRVGSTQGQAEAARPRGSADRPAADRPQHSPTAAPHAGPPRDARCEQIVQNFYSKAAQVIAHLRGYSTAQRASDGDSLAAAGPTGSSVLYASSASSSIVEMGSGGRPVNKWFNLNLEEIGSIREEAKPWRHAAVSQPRPPPMFIEVCLDVSGVAAADGLHVTDIHGRPWTVDLERVSQGGSGAPAPAPESGSMRRRRLRARRAAAIVLEVWRLDLDTAAVVAPAPDLPRVYKQAIVFFRSLYAFASLLPCVALARQVAEDAGDLALFCQFRTESSPRAGVVDLDVGLTNTARFLESYSFDPV